MRVFVSMLLLIGFAVGAAEPTQTFTDDLGRKVEVPLHPKRIVSLHDLETCVPELLVDLVEEADAIAIGSPTINGDAVKPVWNLLSSLNAIELRGKYGAAFGSFGWSGEAVRLIEERLRGLKLRVPVPGVRARLIPTPEELAACRRLGVELAKHLSGTADQRVIDMASLA